MLRPTSLTGSSAGQRSARSANLISTPLLQPTFTPHKAYFTMSEPEYLEPSEEHLRELLTAARAANDALNGTIYPADSLHARGYRSVNCFQCKQVTRLEYLLGERETPNLTPAELAEMQEKAESGPEMYFEKLELKETEVNDWDRGFKPTRRKNQRFNRY